MKRESAQTALQGTDELTSLTNIINQGEQNCKNCRPLTPLTCIASCKIWEQKNELRTLYEKMKNPNFMINLLNTLKNKRRLQILDLISKSKQSVPRLQKELKISGYYHSQQTIAKEYLMPLINVGLAKENENLYSSTLFGCQLKEITKNHHDIDDILPAHSECYEEIVLDMMLTKSRTYEDFEGVVPTKSIARTLNRLQKANLVQTTKENDYIFFFRTKRDLHKAEFSPTEERIYQNIPEGGISARKLCEKTKISLRRTYKYLRRLKGKKLVFTRKKPKVYMLTTKGIQLATMLKELHDLALEVFTIVAQTINNN
ncbi:winged helix-turn-helix transcriptional regulator [Candidatus Bathyarchaeota archaeon]|nr:winged helix-turn-helix transcriptional regulator [Candidatus Bathyarchaeota archaeon]